MPRSIDAQRAADAASSLPWRRIGTSPGRAALSCGLLALVSAVGGCQREQTWNLAAVEGTVTREGRPLPHIEVVFMPDLDVGTMGPRAKGITDEAGRYRLRTDNGDDGVVVGKHRVLFLDPETRKGRRGRNALGPQSPENAKPLENQQKKVGEAPRVPPKSGRFNETPLRLEIQPGPQVVDFDVKGVNVEVKLIGASVK